MLLTEYLDMKNTRTASEPSAQLSYASSGRDCAFFAKKKPQRPKNSFSSKYLTAGKIDVEMC